MSAQQTERPFLNRGEVIVVVFILVILAGLLLPGLNRHVTPAGPSTICLNNLKQMVLAFHTFQTTRKGELPTGTIVGSAKDHEERLSHLVWLLPYLEQETLY